MLIEAPPRTCEPCAAGQYVLANIELAITADQAVLLALDARLRWLASPEHPNDTVAFTFSRDERQVERPGGALRPVYDPDDGEVLYADEQDLLYMAFGNGIRVVCDPVRGRTQVSVPQSPEDADLWLLSHPVFTLPLLETLKRRGRYSVHAAGLGRYGRALLLAGASGSGKTTLAVALARAGFALLGDDMLFLSKNATGVQVHGFADEVDVTDTTAAFFHELRPLLKCPTRRGWPKRSFRPESVYHTAVGGTYLPGAVVSPCIAHLASSRLEPMAPQEAPLELVPNVLLTEAAACQAHLAVLAQLTAEAACYRLWTGQDFDAWPRLLGSLLE